MLGWLNQEVISTRRNKWQNGWSHTEVRRAVGKSVWADVIRERFLTRRKVGDGGSSSQAKEEMDRP